MPKMLRISTKGSAPYFDNEWGVRIRDLSRPGLSRELLKLAMEAAKIEARRCSCPHVPDCRWYRRGVLLEMEAVPAKLAPLCEEAVASSNERSDEDVDEWAETLASDVAGADD